MRSFHVLLIALVAVVGGVGSVHAEAFGVERYAGPELTVPVDHFVGHVDHADRYGGTAVVRLAVPSVPADTSGGPSLGRVALGVGFMALTAWQVAHGDADGAMILAEGVSLAALGEGVDRIEKAQADAIEREKEFKAGIEAGRRTEAEAREEMTRRMEGFGEQLEAVEKAVAEGLNASARPGAGPVLSDTDRAEEAAYAAYVRGGEKRMTVEQHEALTTGMAEARGMSTDSLKDGGLFVPATRSARVLERVYERSPIRQNATVETITTGDRLEVPREADDYDTGWVGERDERPDTGEEDFALITIDAHEQYAQPKVTNRMLSDAGIDVEGRIERGLSRKFGLAEGIAFVTGDGVLKPLGLLSAKTIAEFVKLQGVFNSGSAAQMPDWKVLARASVSLPSDYEADAQWYWNRSTSFVAMTYVDGEDRPLLNFDLVRQGGGMLFLGKQVVHVDAMPAYDLVAGRYTAGDVPVLFGDMAEAYTIVDKAGMAMIVDNVTKKGFTKYYTTRRVGGKTVQPNALRAVRIGA